VIDAEHTWYQPVLDAYTMMLSQEFNKLTPKEESEPSPLI
jgi:proline dehydrogenase